MRILSVDGGGYLGLASASFLAAVERHFSVHSRERFTLFCGTSTGAIVALALASGMTGEEVAVLYERLGKRVFPNGFPLWRQYRYLRSLASSRYGNGELKTVLLDAFQGLTLGDLMNEGKRVMVTAFNMSTGKPRVFKTDHSARLSTDNGYLLRDIALASAAAPTYFPLVRLRSPSSGVVETFCDGGVYANHPALLAYVEAITELGIPPSAVQLLSLSTPRAALAEHDSSRSWLQRQSVWRRFLLERGLVLWGSKLASVLIDSTAMISHEALKRLMSERGGRGQYVRVLFNAPPGTEMDLATEDTTNTLKTLGVERASQNDTRDQLRSFFEG